MKNQPYIFAIVISFLSASALSQTLPAKTTHDHFYWLGEFNKASTVMVVEQNIVTKKMGAQIADGVAKVISDGDKPGAKRPNDYLQLETMLIAAAGPDVTRMHSGRSRQDLLATTNRVVLREQALELLQKVIETRARLAELAGKHVNTIIPAYTNGVQAQPTTLAHYLLAFDAAFGRDAERLRQAYARLNLSPLGAAALGTSSFPVNRPRLAELLGFDGVVENSYDANHVSAMDTSLELVNIAAGMALTTSAFVEDVTAQYRDTRPWMLLREGKLTGTSSIMPQKRNPYGLILLRQSASNVIGESHLFAIQAHNISPGMLDYKLGQADKTIAASIGMLGKFGALLDSLVINSQQALEEVTSEYSTTTELADVLQRDSNVPFRVGHHFASELVTYGRTNGLKPADLPYAEAKRIYVESAKALGIENAELPMSEQRFRQSLDAENMVNASLGLGGPQPAEVKRMLEAQRERVAADQSWLSKQKTSLAAAAVKLDKAFENLRQAQAH
jgi:argininosuccinate lyase